MPFAFIAQQVEAADSRPYADRAEAAAVVRAQNPGWSDGDVAAKAEALTHLDEAAARSVLLDNGDLGRRTRGPHGPGRCRHPGLGHPRRPGRRRLSPDDALPAIEAAVGADHVHTIHGAPHSPQRTHPVETTAAILHALED